MKSKIKNYIVKIATSVMTYLSILWANTYMAYCDVFDDIGNAGGKFQSKLVNLVTVLFPLIIIIDIVCIVFTRDQKKLGMEIGILVSSIIGFLVMLIINNGTLVDTLKNLIS